MPYQGNHRQGIVEGILTPEGQKEGKSGRRRGIPEWRGSMGKGSELTLNVAWERGTVQRSVLFKQRDRTEYK